ncbi:hypothetical protein WNY78_18380 [Psychroserpens sp. AS72]|uniref:hypothetical protein n=1 Tax=Psychroserpens sp. AS72 TaxID=3135775 RepID=UPI0031707080
MTTDEKIEKISDFLHEPNNKLIWNKDKFLSAGTFFDIQMSYNPMNIDFSFETEVNGIEETIDILKSITINREVESIKQDVETKLNEYNINPNQKFYLAIKGNRNEQTAE